MLIQKEWKEQVQPGKKTDKKWKAKKITENMASDWEKKKAEKIWNSCW